MKVTELNRIKAVSKKTISEFVRSETGSVGVKNAAAIGAFAAALTLSESLAQASTTVLPDGTVITAI